MSYLYQYPLNENAHCSSDMFVSRRTKFRHHWKHSSLKRFLFIFTILQMTMMYGSLANRTSVSETQCAKRLTCRSCTEITTPTCSWSVADQMCANSAAAAEFRLVVTNGSFCPTFSVNSIRDRVDVNQITVTVNDTNIGGNFVGLLAHSTVKCQFDHETYEATVINDKIICAGGPLTPKSNSGYSIRCRQFEPTISHLLIVFDDKPLRFDNVNNHYVATYPAMPKDCPAIFECSDCHQDNGTYRTYCWWCGENSYCDVRHILSFELLSNVQINKCSIGDPAEMKSSPKVVQPDQTLGFVGSEGNNGTKVGPTVDEGQALGANDTKIGTTVDEGQVLGVNGSHVNATVDEGQDVFTGIASGGTTFRVWGQRFSRLQNTKVCFINKIKCGSCKVHNDTLMVCRSLAAIPLKLIKIRFYELSSTGKYLNINNRSSLVRYRSYQDPVFTDFVVDGCCNVTIHGLQLDQGYVVEDLSIALIGENSSSGCQVTSIYSTQITCQLSSSSSRSDLPPKQIDIKVGDSLRHVMNLTIQKSSPFKSSFARSLPGIVTISAYVLFIAVLCVALAFMKSSKDYDLLYSQGRLRSAEMRPLGERNSNDCDSENMLTPLSVPT